MAGAGRAGPRSRVGRPGLRSAGRGRWSGSPGGTASPLHNSAGGAGGRRAAQEAGRGAPELSIGDKARPPGAPRAARAGAQPAPPATDMMFPQSRHSVRGTPRTAPQSSPCTPSSAHCTPSRSDLVCLPAQGLSQGFSMLTQLPQACPVPQPWARLQGPCTPQPKPYGPHQPSTASFSPDP